MYNSEHFICERIHFRNRSSLGLMKSELICKESKVNYSNVFLIRYNLLYITIYFVSDSILTTIEDVRSRLVEG